MSDAAGAAGEVEMVIDIVDDLEEMVGAGRRLPFTSSVVVNEEEILELVDRIRVALPDDLVAARHTVEERDELIARAEREVAEAAARAGRDAAEVTARAAEEAARVVREAQAQAAELVSQHAVTRAATERAEAISRAAEEQAAAQRAGADDYAREVMARLAEQLERWLGTVREGLGTLPEAPPEKRRRKS